MTTANTDTPSTNTAPKKSQKKASHKLRDSELNTDVWYLSLRRMHSWIK